MIKTYFAFALVLLAITASIAQHLRLNFQDAEKQGISIQRLDSIYKSAVTAKEKYAQCSPTTFMPVKEEESTLTRETSTESDSVFTIIASFPYIGDTTKFITDLLRFCGIERNPNMVGHERISSFQKVKIYGSDADYILIEYDYAEGSSASYPWKYQFLFTSHGALIEAMSALRLEWVSIFKNENPFLLALSSTSKGNGSHTLYRITGDTLENILDNELDYFLRTYDAHEDNAINQPYEMKLLIEDRNADGLNDISFKGKVILLQAPIGNGELIDGEVIDGKTIDYSISNPFKEVNVEFVFLFDRKSGHFKMKEDYNLKYQELR